MNWYQVLTSIQEHDGPVIDLSTGSPLIVDQISATISECFGTLGNRKDVATELGGYANLDGLPELIQEFAEVCFPFNPQLDDEQILVVPGIQAALRYAHEILRHRRSCQRILFPIGLEFPGAVDPYSPVAPAVGRYQITNSNTPHFRPVIDAPSLDWQGVGAAIVSRPHSPTGCVWSTNEITKLADDASENGAWVILDETYALPSAPLMEEPYTFVDRPNIIHFYSFSKVGLAGERIGIVVASREIIRLFRGALRRNIIQAPINGQHLALAVIRATRRKPEIGKCFGPLYRKRWELCKRLLLSSETSARIASWQGGPFLWCQWFGPPSSDEVFESLLHEGIAVAPGSALWINESSVEERPEAIRIGLGAEFESLERAIPIVAFHLRRASTTKVNN